MGNSSEYPLSLDRKREFLYWRLCDGRCRSRVYYCSCPKRTDKEAYAAVLVPKYREFIANAPVIKELQQKLDNNYDVLICDPSYCGSAGDGYDLVTHEAIQKAESAIDGSKPPYGLLVAGELIRTK